MESDWRLEEADDNLKLWLRRDWAYTLLDSHCSMCHILAHSGSEWDTVPWLINNFSHFGPKFNSTLDLQDILGTGTPSWRKVSERAELLSISHCISSSGFWCLLLGTWAGVEDLGESLASSVFLNCPVILTKFWMSHHFFSSLGEHGCTNIS